MIRVKKMQRNKNEQIPVNNCVSSSPKLDWGMQNLNRFPFKNLTCYCSRWIHEVRFLDPALQYHWKARDLVKSKLPTSLVFLPSLIKQSYVSFLNPILSGSMNWSTTKMKSVLLVAALVSSLFYFCRAGTQVSPSLTYIYFISFLR